MKGIRILAAAGALLMTESLWSCGLFPAEEEELAPPLAAPAAVSYTTTKVERGDIVAVCTTGAYNYSMASNYNRVPRPPIVMLGERGDYLAVRRETLDDIVSLDI